MLRFAYMRGLTVLPIPIPMAFKGRNHLRIQINHNTKS